MKRFAQNLKARNGRGERVEEDLKVAKWNEAKLDWCKYE